MTTRKPSAPRGLKPGGRSLWNTVCKTYTLRPDELRILKDACFEVDLIDELQRQLSRDGVISIGSMGQERAHPAVSELRQHRSVLSALLRALKLPDPATGSAAGETPTSTQARAAVNARWKRQPG